MTTYICKCYQEHTEEGGAFPKWVQIIGMGVNGTLGLDCHRCGTLRFKLVKIG